MKRRMWAEYKETRKKRMKIGRIEVKLVEKNESRKERIKQEGKQKLQKESSEKIEMQKGQKEIG